MKSLIKFLLVIHNPLYCTSQTQYLEEEEEEEEAFA
jgi:hypothetical protein